jgi:hypothetical protein
MNSRSQSATLRHSKIAVYGGSKTESGRLTPSSADEEGRPHRGLTSAGAIRYLNVSYRDWLFEISQFTVSAIERQSGILSLRKVKATE